MKKILIILTFLFVSIFAYSDSAISYSKSVNIDFDVRVMMGLTKIEENDNPKYKKFLNYIDENLVKKGEVKYSHKLNMDKKAVEFFSEKGEILLTENLPKEFLDIIDNSIRVAVNKEEIKKTIKNIYEDPYTHVSISKYKENLILFTEQNMVNRGKIKNTMSVVLKRELTDNEKNEVSKVIVEYSDNNRINSVVKSYKNDKLLKETFIKNKKIVLEKEYYASGKLARETPLKDGLINGEAKDYYKNGKIRSTATFVNGHIDGVVKEYNQAGKVIKETLYKNGKKVK